MNTDDFMDQLDRYIDARIAKLPMAELVEARVAVEDAIEDLFASFRDSASVTLRFRT